MIKLFSFEGLQLVITFMTAMAASSGFWLYINKRSDGKDLSRKLLIGLAHDRIMCLGMEYLERGYVTQDEYENLCVFLYQPYIEMGGNGSAKRLMAEVDKLPIMKKSFLEKTKPIKELEDDSQQ